MKYKASSAILILYFAFLSGQTLACTCIIPRAPLVELQESDFVFSGVVKSITPIDTGHGGTLIVRMQVLSKWKGDFGDEVVVQTADNSAACGYHFERNKSYLVYGYLDELVMRTGLCTRTTLLEDAEEDLRDLAEGEEVSSYRPRCGGPTSAGALQAFLFLFAGFFVLPRKPASYGTE